MAELRLLHTMDTQIKRAAFYDCPYLIDSNGAPGMIRTCDPLIRSQVITILTGYPAISISDEFFKDKAYFTTCCYPALSNIITRLQNFCVSMCVKGK